MKCLYFFAYYYGPYRIKMALWEWKKSYIKRITKFTYEAICNVVHFYPLIPVPKPEKEQAG